MQESLNLGDRALLQGQDTHMSAERPGPTTSSACLGSHAALLDGFVRKTVLHRRWKSGIYPSHTCLPSRLPSLLTEPLLSLLDFYPRAWGQSTLGNWMGVTTQSHRGLWTLAGPLRPTKASGLIPPRPSPPSPLAECSLHLSPLPHQRLFPLGEVSETR